MYGYSRDSIFSCTYAEKTSFSFARYTAINLRILRIVINMSVNDDIVVLT